MERAGGERVLAPGTVASIGIIWTHFAAEMLFGAVLHLEARRGLCLFAAQIIQLLALQIPVQRWTRGENCLEASNTELELGLFSWLLSTAAERELKHRLSSKGSCSNLIQLVAVTSMGKLSAVSL